MLSLRSPKGSVEVECVDDYEEVSPWLTATTWVFWVREGKRESRVKLGELQPMVVLVEDLHWCDPSSLELLGRLVTKTSYPELWEVRNELTALSQAEVAGGGQN